MAEITRGKVIRDDAAWFDGVTRTASRPDATGGTVSGLNFGDEVDVLQVFGDGSSRTLATINDAITRQGGNDASFRFTTGTWTITDNLTVPANIASHIPSGCVFDVSSGKTLTFAGPVFKDAGTWTSGSGTVLVTANNNAPIWGRIAAETSASIVPSNLEYATAPYDVRRAGIVPDDSGARTANTTAIKALFASDNTGPVGKFIFPNITGTTTYYFDGFVHIRDGCHLDLCNTTLDFAKTYESADDGTAFIWFVRNCSIENGSINCDYNGAAGATGGSKPLQIGNRVDGGGFFLGDEDAIADNPYGNCTVRNLSITFNNQHTSNNYGIIMLGGLINVLIENVTIDGTNNGLDGILYEYGFWDNPAGSTSDVSAHMKNCVFRNIYVKDLDSTDTSTYGLDLRGTMSVLIDGLYVDGAGGCVSIQTGEAMYYRMGDLDTNLYPTAVLRNIHGRALTGTGLNLDGSNDHTGTYLNGEGLVPDDEVDLITFSVDGFSLDDAAVGIAVSAPASIRNGRITNCSSEGIRLDDECVDFSIDRVDVLDGGSIGIRGDFGSGQLFAAARLKVGSITNCFVAGNASNGIALNDCAAVYVGHNRIGYDVLHDAAAETTQTIGISLGTECTGVVCDSNLIATSGGNVGYRNQGTGSKSCEIRNGQGVITTNGSWIRDGVDADSATNLVDATAPINTVGKHIYKLCWDNSVNKRLMIAQGPDATDTWISADDGTVVTPT